MSASALSMAMPMSIPSPKGRILCVDDETNILRALSWLLQKEFEVVTAASGLEGLELVRKDNFDVVISDQRMPEMSGVDFLKEVKAIAPRAIRILLTGYSDLQAVQRSVNESEIFRYITKPWNISELPRIVGQAAEIARGQSDEAFSHDMERNSGEAFAADAKILLMNTNPDIYAAVRELVGDKAAVLQASNVGDAVHAIKEQGVGVIVAENRLGSVDLTRLLCLMKRRHPAVVSVILAAEADAEQVAKLVNRGQVFRFVPMPIKPCHLREALHSALHKNRHLKSQPDLARRHEVEELSEEEHEALQLELISAASAPPPPYDQASPPSLSHRMGGILRRLFSNSPGHA